QKTGNSTDREDNHTKTSEEYSTEDRRGQCGSGAASDNIHTCPLEQAERREVGRQQGQQDLAVAESYDSDHQDSPQERSQSQGVRQSRLAQSSSHRRAERQLLGHMKRQ